MHSSNLRRTALQPVLALLLALAWLWGATPAAAGPAAAPARVAPEEPAASEVAPAVVPADDPLMTKARQLVALMEGTLDPSVDPADVLVLELSDTEAIGPGGVQLVTMLQQAASAPADDADDADDVVPQTPLVLDGMEPAAAFEAAYVAFSRLGPERRAELLAAQASKRAAVTSARQDAERRVAALTRRADALQAYLEGTLDLEVDPSTVLQVDLADEREVGLSSARRAQWLASSAATPTPAPTADADVEVEGDEATGDEAEGDEAAPSSPPEAPDPSADRLVAASARLDGLRRQYLALSVEQRAALRAAHEQRIADAAKAAEVPEPEPIVEEPTDEEANTAQVISEAESEAQTAAADRQAALEAARQAKTEAKRLLSEERARLLGVKEAQARYGADLNRRKAIVGDNHDKALEWSRRVGELAASAQFESEKAAEADPMYEQIRSDLAAMRDRLRDELANVRRAGDDVPTVGEGLDRDLPADIDRGDLVELRDGLLAKERSLTELEQTVAWDLAQGLRDDVVLLNRTRLALLELSSPSLRASVTGFGQAGVDQVKGELDQISVELSFHALRLPRYRNSLWSALQGSTIALLIGSIQLLLVLAVYVWWRRRGGELLERLVQFLQAQRPSTRLHSGGITVLWYLQRVRRPLELLLVLWVLLGSVGSVDGLSELDLLWIVALWVLLGLSVILFVDALAARETLYSTDGHDTSVLRIKSLRLVGLNVIAVGLILSLTSAMVGQGAIYSWVISTCWLLSFPVALYLVHQWRPIIFERIGSRAEQGPFTLWVTSKKEGLASFPAATAAAAFLLGAGLGSWVMRQLSGLEATRRLLAYLFRREVAKRAAATVADERFVPIDARTRAVFERGVSPDAVLADVAAAQIDRVAELASSPRPTLSIVVGERGLGKSMFLERVAAKLGRDKVRVMSCPEAGFEALLGELAALAGDPKLRGHALAEALRAKGPLVIALDDLQRLVVPAVNGLQDLDAFTTFAREVGGTVSWVATIGSASWHYVTRARGDRVFFEQVVMIPRWTEDELGELIQGKCAEAEVQPSFDGLVVPRQSQAPLPDQGNRTEAGYYRLLWDFSKGNPAVALRAFGESLFVGPDGNVVVRLFKTPPAEEIEDLPLSILFVLRSVVQLEWADVREVEAATQLPTSDIEDAFRFCQTRGYLEPVGGGVRMAWTWYRTITTVLQRQHLLSSI